MKHLGILTSGCVVLVGTLNEAIGAAPGPLIARMDADDISHFEPLARRFALINDSHLGMVSCRVNFGGARKTYCGYAEYVDWVNTISNPEDIAIARFIESPIVHPSVPFRRELQKLHGRYREGDFPEDYELWLRWLDAGIPFGKVDAPLFTWNDPPMRLSRTDPRYSIEAFYRIECHYLRRWLARNVPPERPIWLWGAGRVTRKDLFPWKRSTALSRFRGHRSQKSRPDGRRPSVVTPDDIPPGVFLLIADYK